MDKVYNFSDAFIDRWNYLATEGEIYPDGVSELKLIAATTKEKDDDDFLAAIESVTIDEFDDHFDSSAILCKEANAAARAGLDIRNLDIYFIYSKEDKRSVKINADENACSAGIKTIGNHHTLSCLCSTPGHTGDVAHKSLLSLLMVLIFD